MHYLAKKSENVDVGFEMDSPILSPEERVLIALSKLRFVTQLMMMPMLLSSHSFDETKSSLFSRNMIFTLKQQISSNLSQLYRYYELYTLGRDSQLSN